jgi:hypothetical protein
MIIKHDGVTPRIDPAAWIAPNAVICGNVTIGPSSRVMFGAQIIAEGGSITIGRECIIMENSVLRSSARHSLSIANNCLIGPNAHVVGCTLEDEVFIATGAAVFHSARVGKGSEVCASTEWCTSRPISPQDKPYRSAGSRLEILLKCYRRASMTVSGISRSSSTFHSPFMASNVTRQRPARSRIVYPKCYARIPPTKFKFITLRSKDSEFPPGELRATWHEF